MAPFILARITHQTNKVKLLSLWAWNTMAIIPMLNFKVFILHRNMKVIFKNNFLSCCCWRIGPNKFGCLSQLEMKAFMAQCGEETLTAHFVHHERCFLTWWLLSETTWPYKNNQIVNVSSLPQFQDVKPLSLILLETVQLHSEYNVWAKISPSTQTFSICTFKRIFEML